MSTSTTPRTFPALALLVASSSGCVDGINLFTIQDDLELGQQLHDEILAHPRQYPLLDRADHPEAYEHLDRMREEVLESGQLTYEEDFPWEMYIIDDDGTLNAFAAPGGYLYFYTGLIHYLDNEDSFVGVMGHEVAHADERHSTEQLTKAYGLSTLVGLVLGKDPGLLAEIALGLTGLSFSRANESEADEWSVRYLCETSYAADGAAGFFEQLEEEGGVGIPEFLSTHPSPGNRVHDIHGLADELGCSTKLAVDEQYEAFKASLP